MIRGFLNSTAPVMASAGLYGIGANTLGMTLLIVMALAVIINQVWTLVDRVRGSMRSVPDLTGVSTTQVCEQHQRRITAALEALKTEDARQDRSNADKFAVLADALRELKNEMREDIKGLHKRSDDVLRAVSRLEGKVQ